MNRKLLASAICASLFVAGTAYAQDNPAPQQSQDQSQTTQSSTNNQSQTTTSSSEQDKVKTLEKVTVTGSLLKRPEYQTTVPVQVVPIKADMAAGKFSVTDFIQTTAAAAGSTQINGQFNGFVIQGGTGVKPIDLRGLGPNRTLVLLDGQRPGPAGTRGQVNAFDLNVIPRAIIGRIEIVKNGSSSIYGSDAIAGVVNLITKKRLDHTTMDFFVSAPEHDGGEQYSASIATGWNFKNGNITFAAEADRQQELKVGQRDYFKCFQDRVYGSNGQRVDIPDSSIIGNTPLGGCNNLLVDVVIDPFSGASPGARYVPSKDGSTGPNSPVPGYVLSKRTTYRTTSTPSNDQVTNFPQFGDSFAINRNQSSTAYLASTFTFGNVNWDTQLLFNHRTTNANGWRQFFPIVFNDNGWSTADSSFYGGSDTKQSGFEPVMLFPFNNKITVDYGYLRTGLSGGFGNSSWSWAANVSYSKSDGDYDSLGISAVNSADWNNPLNKVTGRSAVNYFDPGIIDGSKINELIAAVGQPLHGNTVFEQKLANFVANGELFDLPAGPISAAFGAEYRHTSIDDLPPPASWGLSGAGETKGADHVTEVFGELGVPILKGLPAIDSLSADLSFREFKYSSVGESSHVWKYGLNWQVIPSLRIRGTIGTSYRAPALYELYLANQTGFVGQLGLDPCIDWATSTTNVNIQKNCAAAGVPGNYTGVGPTAEVSQGGGAGFLKPETSRAKSLGFVWSPTFANLQVALDYFDYNIRGEIETLTANDIVTGCYNKPVYPNEFCTHFQRNPGTGPNPYNITAVQATYINVNQQRERGYDLQMNYAQDLPFGRLSVDGEVTYALEHIQQLFSSAAASGFDTTDYTGSISNPRWIGIVNTSLARGDWSFNWQMFYTSATDDYAFADRVINYNGLPNVTQYLRAGAQVRHSVSVGYDQGNLGIMFGIRNLFDAKPPQVSGGAPENFTGNTVLGASQYDWFGRTYFARLSIKI